MTARWKAARAVPWLAAAVALAALAPPIVGFLTWHSSRMHWLETGAALPIDIRIEETLYTHMEVEFCAEAVYRIDAATAQDMQQWGAAFFSTLGPNREGEVLQWQPAENFVDVSIPQTRSLFSDGPFCFGGGPPLEERMWDWPNLPVYAPGAYAARDDHGTILVINPAERLAYFWNQ